MERLMKYKHPEADIRNEIIKKLMGINAELGLSMPVIVTPEELMEELNDK
jgi:hypothetical protein